MSDEDKEELTKFMSCLEEADFKIYGANWCGWTKKLVTMLGGFEMVEPIYVECTERVEDCQNAGIMGYPTIFIKGERYEGQRTFEAFSAATDCAAPSVTGTQQTNPTGGQC